MSYAQRSGYQRWPAANFAAGGCRTGRGGAGTEMSHAAPLSLEMSYAQDRILVNCGPNLVHGEKWHLASRGGGAFRLRLRRGYERSIPAQWAGGAGVGTPAEAGKLACHLPAGGGYYRRLAGNQP